MKSYFCLNRLSFSLPLTAVCFFVSLFAGVGYSDSYWLLRLRNYYSPSGTYCALGFSTQSGITGFSSVFGVFVVDYTSANNHYVWSVADRRAYNNGGRLDLLLLSSTKGPYNLDSSVVTVLNDFLVSHTNNLAVLNAINLDSLATGNLSYYDLGYVRDVNGVTSVRGFDSNGQAVMIPFDSDGVALSYDASGNSGFFTLSYLDGQPIATFTSYVDPSPPSPPFNLVTNSNDLAYNAETGLYELAIPDYSAALDSIAASVSAIEQKDFTINVSPPEVSVNPSVSVDVSGVIAAVDGLGDSLQVSVVGDLDSLPDIIDTSYADAASSSSALHNSVSNRLGFAGVDFGLTALADSLPSPDKSSLLFNTSLNLPLVGQITLAFDLSTWAVPLQCFRAACLLALLIWSGLVCHKIVMGVFTV